MRPWIFYSLSFVNLILLVGGLLVLAWLPSFIHEQIKDRMSLRDPTTQLYQAFSNQSASANGHLDIFKVLYYFNITNRAAVEGGTEFPKVDEIGPFYYRRIRRRLEDDIEWLPNGTMRYKDTTYYRFERDLSCCDETVEIETVRAGVLFAFQTVSAKDFPTFEKLVFDLNAYRIQTIFTRRTVRELSFGYNESFLKHLDHPELVSILHADAPPGTTQPYEIYSGAQSSTTQPAPPNFGHELGKFTMYEGMRDLSKYWITAEAQKLEGSDGSTYSPFMENEATITAFVEPLIRPVVLDHFDDAEIGDLTVRRYRPRPDAFAANDRNAGYGIFQDGFQPKPPVQQIDPENIYGCITKQHYYMCNTSGVNVQGVKPPDAERDETHLEFEPHTGTMIRVRKRSMLSMRVRTMFYDGGKQIVTGTVLLKPTWLPVMSETEEMTLPKVLRDKIHDEVIVPLKIYKPVGAVLVVVACLLQGAYFYFHCCGKKDEKEGDGFKSHDGPAVY